MMSAAGASPTTASELEQFSGSRARQDSSPASRNRDARRFSVSNAHANGASLC